MTLKVKPAVLPAAITKYSKGDSAMGEVRVQVKLTNAVDEGMLQRGLLKPEQVRTYTADALVDTGSVMPVLPIQVAQQLGLRFLGKTKAEYANGSQEVVDLTDAVSMEIEGRGAILQTMVLGTEVIIGQMVLEQMDYLVDCNNRRLIGNPAHPDQPVLKVK
ncbi:MAG: clan AA aspartic protease [Blastocatellales bacterium]